MRSRNGVAIKGSVESVMIIPLSMEMVVVLPAPLWPRRAVI